MRMPLKKLEIDQLITERLILIPYTIILCNSILKEDYSGLGALNIVRGKGWPDADVLDTLPRIINNLSKLGYPTGYESWMIVKKESMEIIGDLGFKGYQQETKHIDLGYGIIEAERGKGYAAEAVKELIQWALSTGIVKEITANCLIDNLGSIRLLQKFDFAEVRVDDGMQYWRLVNKAF